MSDCLSESLVWVSETLAEHGLRQTGEPQTVRERPWSLVAKVPTTSGLWWFKENRAGTRYEAGLIEALARWAPGRVLPPLAVDADRGWSLLPDGGPTVREATTAPDLSRWEELLSQHASFQRDVGVRVDGMLALGVPDQRPGRMPALLDALVDTLPLPEPVVAYRPVLAGLCEELAASPIPPSIQHDDLHDANVFADGRFFDWGDAAVAHPFGVLLITLRVAAQFFDGPALDRLRDAYLEPWSDLAGRSRLLRDVELAAQVAKAGRALAWQRALTQATAEDLAGLDDPVGGWLEELVKPA